jgi:hypothetical protein
LRAEPVHRLPGLPDQVDQPPLVAAIRIGPEPLRSRPMLKTCKRARSRVFGYV